MPIWILVRLYASVKPSDAPLHCLMDSLLIDHCRYNIIQLHHNITPNRVLNLHRPLRRQLKLSPINVALKGDPLLIERVESPKRHNLKPPTIRQQISIPVHKLVQTADLVQEVLSGLQEQMISIGKHNITINLLIESGRQDCLHSTLGADWHVDGGSNEAVGKGHVRNTASAKLFQDIEIQGRSGASHLFNFLDFGGGWILIDLFGFPFHL